MSEVRIIAVAEIFSTSTRLSLAKISLYLSTLSSPATIAGGTAISPRSTPPAPLQRGVVPRVQILPAPEALAIALEP